MKTERSIRQNRKVYPEVQQIMILFQDPNARRQLLNHGVVLTFRWRRRKHLGSDWACQIVNGKKKKIADVSIYLLGTLPVSQLTEEDAWYSGFHTLKEWQSAILSFKPKSVPQDKEGYLYEVEIRPLPEIRRVAP